MKLTLPLRFLVFSIILLNVTTVKSQAVDSLMKLYKSQKEDTIRVRLLLNMGELMYMQDPDSADRIWHTSLNMCEEGLKKNNPSSYGIVYKKFRAYSQLNISAIKLMHGEIKDAIALAFKCTSVLSELKDEQGLGNAYSNLSQFYYSTGAIDSAAFYAEKALVLFKKVKSIPLIGTTLNNLGLFYDNKGDFPKALKAYYEGLKLMESINDKKGIGYIYHNIAGIYDSQKDYQKALEYYEKSLEKRKQINDQFGIADSYLALGSLKRKKNETKEALEYLEKALAIEKAINNPGGMSVAYNNIGNIYRISGDLKKAIEYIHKCLEIQEKIQDKNGLTFSYNNLGSMYLIFKDYDKALLYSQKSLKLSKELGFPENIKMSASQLYSIYKIKGNHQLALENYLLFIKMKDSLNNIESQRSLIKQQTNFEYQQKKAVADAEHKAQLKQQEELAEIEKNKQWIVLGSVCIVLLIVIIFSVFLFNRFKVTQKQKQVIELKEKETHEQKLIIEEKHKEITDSINYAGRIQRSFLATTGFLDEYLSVDKTSSNYFIFYKPKAIVSGDFYWASKLLDGNFAFVTADSTGHGVPGAIMSLLNIMSLEKAIEHHTKPNEILNTTREIIIERLKKDGSADGGKDGMDCSIIVFDFKTKKSHIAAANNPVWIIRKKELIEIKPDKMPVGKSDHHNESFTQHTVELQSGDMVYTLTDGFADQFGGQHGKKYKSKNLKELLTANSHLALNEQQQLLEKEFNNWIGSLEQIDDITVIGIKIP